MALPAHLGNGPVRFSDLPDIQWHPGARVPAARIPPSCRGLVLSRDSLTRRLKRRCRTSFGVQVLSERFARPSPRERRLLGLHPRELCWIREVLLIGDGRPWVLARTLMPVTTLRGRFRRLRHLGRKPLGEVLFREHGWQRGPLEVGCFHSTGYGTAGFARRSAFRNDRGIVLITEVFFPVLWEHQAISERTHRAA